MKILTVDVELIVFKSRIEYHVTNPYCLDTAVHSHDGVNYCLPYDTAKVAKVFAAYDVETGLYCDNTPTDVIYIFEAESDVLYNYGLLDAHDIVRMFVDPDNMFDLISANIKVTLAY